MSSDSTGFSESVQITSDGTDSGTTSHTEVVENGEKVVDETRHTGDDGSSTS